MPLKPSYIEAFETGRLAQAVLKAREMLKLCVICPRRCGVDRLAGKTGFCRTAKSALVYSYMCHQGEEPPVSGKKGSGTIFFANCNMGCVYCQNYEFSQQGRGREIDAAALSKIMLELQQEGAHNINFVTPTHVMPQILEALSVAIPAGLCIPIVYNSGGYELPDAIKLLEGIVDVYLVDMRYGSAENSLKYSAAAEYPYYNQASVLEMQRQVGVAQFDDQGMVYKGVIIRHLVLPAGISGTEQVMDFISSHVSAETYISLMSQYLPYYKAKEFPLISSRISSEEYQKAQEAMAGHGLHNGWIQESFGLERFAGVNIKQWQK